MYPKVESSSAPPYEINYMQDIFQRVDSNQTLPKLLESIVDELKLGTIISSAPIPTGYQDCNIDLTTTNGRYVVKIFSKEHSKQRIEDISWIYTSASKHGIPIPEVFGITHDFSACVFSFFDGKSLTRTPATDTDLVTLTNAMTKIHSVKRDIHHYYDTMGIVNLSTEYSKKISALSPEEQMTISPVIHKFQKIKLSTFPQSIIHGAFEKENVLKNTNGDICLLDFGCMDFNASILDIATFIANFTLYLDPLRRKLIIHLILETYQKYRPLLPEELSALPTLIRSQYTAYIICMSYHMRIEHDMTKQTQSWLDRGWDGLHAYQDIKKLV